jgi:sulfur-oxidizing protein SoxX
MMSIMHRFLIAGLVLGLALPVAAQAQTAAPASGAADAQGVVAPDETQRLCSLRQNMPGQDEAAQIREREAKTIVLPADGHLLGDWQRGAQVAHSDAAGPAQGEGCYACHRIDRAEATFGTSGPSISRYGLLRDYDDDEIKAAYAKIYNARSKTACSVMPRFGADRILTEQQIKDVLAYLFDPASPVNKP